MTCEYEINWNADNGAEMAEMAVRINITKRVCGKYCLNVRGGAATRWYNGLHCAISAKDANYIMHDAQSFNDCLPILLKYSR